MRKSIWITCVVVLAVCLLLLFKTTHHQNTASPEQSEAVTNQPSQPLEQPKAVENQQASNTSRTTAVPPVVVAQAVVPGESNAVNPQLLTDWQAPIEFYGKVIDENSNPVSSVNIHFRWMELPAKDGARTSDAQSDTEGLFSLHGKRGRSLTVWFGKDGYYSSQGGQKTFLYALGPDILSPDPQNPVVFHLRKQGKPESLVTLNNSYRIPRDGTPVSVDLATGANTTGTSGNFVVQCWTNDQGKKSGEKYDWRCLITIPGGGVVPTDEEFAFLAPENGYALTNEIAMPADRTNWTSQVDLKFFYRLADGRYGRMTFSMIAGGQHFCLIDSVLNPTGSRNLEPSN
jgi:hypothetical protein